LEEIEVLDYCFSESKSMAQHPPALSVADFLGTSHRKTAKPSHASSQSSPFSPLPSISPTRPVTFPSTYSPPPRITAVSQATIFSSTSTVSDVTGVFSNLSTPPSTPVINNVTTKINEPQTPVKSPMSVPLTSIQQPPASAMIRIDRSTVVSKQILKPITLGGGSGFSPLSSRNDQILNTSNVNRFTTIVQGDPNAPINIERVMSEQRTVNEREKQEMMARAMRDEIRLEPLNIVATVLTIWSKDDMVKQSVVKITSHKINGDNKMGTPDDPRLGTLDNDKMCATCKKSNMDCPGHLGYIQLNHHFLHPCFGLFAIQVLTCVCNSCSGLLVNRGYMEQQRLLSLQGPARLKKLAEVCAKLPCNRYVGSTDPNRRRCAPNPVYETSKIKTMYNVKYRLALPGPDGKRGRKPKKGEEMEALRPIKDIKTIFENISPEDIELMGFTCGAHPKRFILEVLAVIPPCARPKTVRDGATQIDYLTSAYQDIISNNNSIVTESDPMDREKNIRNLHFYISHMIDNTDGKYTRSPTEPVLSVKERITSKEGIIRGLLMGKRVNFCLRTVLGPGAELPFGWLGLPEAARPVLTIPVVVHQLNTVYIRELYSQGQIAHIIPGSGKLRGCRIVINQKTMNNYTPVIGDIVERWSRDGDWCLFNRQPTLSKYSIMAYRIKFGPWKTIRMHMSATRPHNADFDGDEGNVHMLQTVGSQVEAATFASIESNILNSHTNSASIGIVYNGISSIYMLTQRNLMLTQKEMDAGLQCLTYREDLPSLSIRLAKYKDQIAPLSGCALFSALLPSDFWYEKKVKNNLVQIREGILISGYITKDHIGVAGNTIIQSMLKWCRRKRTTAFITDCTYLSDWYIEHRGLTVGYIDCIAPNADKVEEVINRDLTEIQLKISALGPDRPDMGDLEKEYREKQIRSFLDNTAAIGQKIANQALSKDNPLNIMSESKAKGSDINTAQITGLLGQQFIKGMRPAMTITGGTRVLPYFDRNSTDIAARGFCSSSFMKGLDPAELFFHAMATRIGLMDTATKTSDVGHMQHRMVKVMEDVTVRYDGSVRNSNGVIFQYSHLDGFDAAQLVNTHSSSTGSLTSFISLEESIGRINTSYGYDQIRKAPDTYKG
jgi:DNA-directed RNA polymerase II subunit RPB1